MIVTIHFTVDINSSLQIGDMVFASPLQHLSFTAASGRVTLGQSGPGSSSSASLVVGKLMDIQPGYIRVDNSIDGDYLPANISSLDGYFISFAKDIRVNESSLKGYYASVKLVNNSNEKTELFSISSDIVPSSK